MLSEYFIREHEPLFLNEGTSQFELELKKLEAIAPLVADDDRERIERDIRLYRAGIAGEQRIAFELCNSHYPLVFIHDLHLGFEGTEAQIDYLVVTPCNTIVIECKNMVGDIEINRDGAFIRTFGKGVRRRREGIYSPITQNKRHVELLKAIVRSQRGKAIQFAQQFFLDDYYHSVVVLANDKSLLLGSEAPDEVRRQVIRADQLIEQTNSQAQEIYDSAMNEAGQIRTSAMAYTDEMLENLEKIMDHTLDSAGQKYNNFLNAIQSCLDIVKKNRAELAPQTGSSSYTKPEETDEDTDDSADDDE